MQKSSSVWAAQFPEKNAGIVFMRERRLTTKFTYIENFMNVNSTENKARGRGARMMCELFNWLHRKASTTVASALRHLSTTPSVYASCMTCHSMFLHKKFQWKITSELFPSSCYCVLAKCFCKSNTEKYEISWAERKKKVERKSLRHATLRKL